MKRLLLTLAFFTTIAVHIGAYTVRYMVGREPVKVVYNTTKVESDMECPDEYYTIVEDGVTWNFVGWSRTYLTTDFYETGNYEYNKISSDFNINYNYDVYAVYKRTDWEYYDRVTSTAGLENNANYLILGGVKLSSTQYYTLDATKKGDDYNAESRNYTSSTDYSGITTLSFPKNNRSTDFYVIWQLKGSGTSFAMYNSQISQYISESHTKTLGITSHHNNFSTTAQYFTFSFSGGKVTIKNNSTDCYLVASYTYNTNNPHFDWDSNGKISYPGESWLYLYKERKPLRQYFKFCKSIEIVEWLSTNQVKIESYVLHQTSTPYTSDYAASYTSKNSDGTYTVQFNKAKGQTLGLRWYDLGSYIKYQSVKVPHMYSGTNTWSSVTATAYQPDTGEDIVLLRNATVTSSWNYTLNKITLYPGSILNLTGGTIQVDTLILHTDGDEFTSTLPVINFKGGTLNVKKLFIDRRIDESRFYWIGTPYNQYFTTASQNIYSDIKYADFYANGAVLPDMNTDYFIYAYDGKTRNTENVPDNYKSYWTPIETLSGSTVGQINNGNAFLFGMNDQKESTGHTYRTYRFYQYYFNNYYCPIKMLCDICTRANVL